MEENGKAQNGEGIDNEPKGESIDSEPAENNKAQNGEGIDNEQIK